MIQLLNSYTIKKLVLMKIPILVIKLTNYTDNADGFMIRKYLASAKYFLKFYSVSSKSSNSSANNS